MSNSDNSLMKTSQASTAEERVHDITKERHALELRAEVINLVAGRKAERKGLSDRLEIGIESATDTAYGKEELHVGGGLTEEANTAETTGLMLSTTVYGKLNLNYYSDTLITAGGMLEQYTGGEFIAAGMSDNLLGGGGIRIRGADLRMNAVSVMEEKVSTLAIDGLVAECCSTACEREEGNAIYSVGFASYKGAMEVLTGTTYRPMTIALFGVRTKNRGGGGGGGDSNEPSPEQSPAAAAASPEQSPAAAAASPEPLQPTNSLLSSGSSSNTTTSLVRNAENLGQMEDVVTNTDNAIHARQVADTAKLDELENVFAAGDARAAQNALGDDTLKTINRDYIEYLDDFISTKEKALTAKQQTLNKTNNIEMIIKLKKNIKKIKSSISTVKKIRKAVAKSGRPIDILNQLSINNAKNNLFPDEAGYESYAKVRAKLESDIVLEVKFQIHTLKNKKLLDPSTIISGPPVGVSHQFDDIKNITATDGSIKKIRRGEEAEIQIVSELPLPPQRPVSQVFSSAVQTMPDDLADFYKKAIDDILIDNNKEIIKTKDDLIDAKKRTGEFKGMHYEREGMVYMITERQQFLQLERKLTNQLKKLSSAAEDPISILDRLYAAEVKRIGQIPEKNRDFTKKNIYLTIRDRLIEARNKGYTPSAVNNNDLSEIRPTPRYTDQPATAYDSDAQVILNNSDEATKAQYAEDAIQQSSRQGDNYDDTVMGADSNSAQKNITNSPEPIYAALDFSQNPVDSIQSNRPKTAYSDIKFDALSTPVEAYKDRSNLILRSNNQLGAGNVSPPSLKDIIQKNLNISSDQVKIKEGVSATDDVPSQQIAKLSTDKPSTFNTLLEKKEAGWIVSPASENVYLIPSPSRIEPEVPRPQSNSSFYGTGKTVSEDGYKSSETFNLSGADDPFSNKNDPFSDSDSLSRIGSDNPSELADSNRPPQTPPPDYNSVVFESLDSNTGSSPTLTGSPLEETGRPVQNPGSPLINEPVPTNTRQTFKDHIGPVVNPDSASTSPVKHQDLPSNPLSIDNTQINHNLNSFESTKSNELLRMDVSDLDTSLTGGQNRTSTLDNGGFQKKELRTPGDRIEWAGNEDIINEPILLQRNKEMYEQISSGAMTPQFYSKPSSKYKPKFHSKPLFEYNPKFRKNSFFNKSGNAQLPSQLDVRAPKLNKPKRKTFIDEFRKKPARAEITNLSDATNTSLSKNTTDIGSVTDVRQLDAALDLKPTKRPPIETPEQLEDFVRSTYGKNVGDTTKSSSKLKGYDVYEYSGIVYRGDGNEPFFLNNYNRGFSSRNSITVRKNGIEATGLGKSKGATGQSGVSTSKYLQRVIGDSNSGIKDYGTGFVYIIDTDLLPKNNKYKAYDIEEILRNNGLKQIGGSRGKVNITEIPMEAIIGWIRITSGGNVGKAVSNGEDLFSDNIRSYLEFIVKDPNTLVGRINRNAPGADDWMRYPRQ